MKINNNILMCKSTPDNYNKEKLGVKNNTVRIFKTNDELKEYAEIIKLKDQLKQIKIINTEINNHFIRDLSDITLFERDDLKMVIFSWKGFICNICEKHINYDKCVVCSVKSRNKVVNNTKVTNHARLTRF